MSCVSKHKSRDIKQPRSKQYKRRGEIKGMLVGPAIEDKRESLIDKVAREGEYEYCVVISDT
jgi:hypothetical protein